MALGQHTPVTENRLLYRGVSGMSLDKETLQDRDFVEFGFSSATRKREVAVKYSGATRLSDGQTLATIFEIEIGKVDNGADLSQYSQ